MQLPRPRSEGRSGTDPVWLGLLLLLALVPIPFGSNRPWSWSAMSLWASLLLGAWAIIFLRGRRPLVWRRALVVPLGVAALLLGWIFASIWPGLAPPNPIWRMVSEQLNIRLPEIMAVSVDAALVALMRMLAYATIFWISLQYTRNRKRAEHLLIWISWTGLGFALYGLILGLWR